MRNTSNQVQRLLKTLKYKKEIYSRAVNELRYKEFVFTAWYNDPHTLEHFLVEREAYPDVHKSWVQPETAAFARAVRALIEEKYEDS